MSIDRHLLEQRASDSDTNGIVGGIIGFCLRQKLVVFLLTLAIIAAGIATAPFDWQTRWLPRTPVAVDAIPDIGENQQIVFTEWPGRSAQDVQDQITYPLTTALLGVPGVKTVRSTSMFGFSSIFVIFDERVEFYWSRSRILEKLASLPAGLLPEGIQPSLGPDATGLGQVYWYTLEGRDPYGNPVGGWDLHELRSIQDWTVRYALASAEGVSEVASIGGYVREYQVDVDPDAMRAAGVTILDVYNAVRASNLDVGARTVEINRVEYVVRGLGFIRDVSDIEQSVVRVTEDHVPIRIADVAHVRLGPAERRGALDNAGAEAVGGIVTVRYGYNPLQAIQNVKRRIEQIAPGLPARPVVDWTQTTPDHVRLFAQAQGFDAFNSDGHSLNADAWLAWLRARAPDVWPQWITISQVQIVPFYDRTGLIHETLGTLNKALVEQILITVIVVLVMLVHLRSSVLISSMLPLAVLLCFVAMRVFGVDANVVALSGIAIAIGTIVDMGIILTENILKHLREADPRQSRLAVVHRASTEVGGAVLTAVATTVISFLPVFTMIGAEGKLFRPLAFTKTFALMASILIALTIVPAAAHLLLPRKKRSRELPLRSGGARLTIWALNVAAALLVALLLTRNWMPLGLERGLVRNLIFVVGLVGGLLTLFWLFYLAYGSILGWCLDRKAIFLALPLLLIVMGSCVWLGFDRVFGFIPATAQAVGIDPQRVRLSGFWVWANHAFPGLGREFMPSLDEGSFLFMPTVMPHASIGEAMEIMQIQNTAIAAIPEVETVVGKLGRAESALDPAPVSMFETLITYKPEFTFDEHGHPVRQWREHIRSPHDIWREIERAAAIPGVTGAPRLQPIETRIIMLQSGILAPMAVRIGGPDLATIERVGIEIERLLKQGVPGVETATVRAGRIVGKPYLHIVPDRQALARFGINAGEFQEFVEIAIGGRAATTTVEGRERYPVRVRYPRELREDIDDLMRVLVPTSTGQHIPLGELAHIEYVRGPMEIRTEDTFLVNFVTFGYSPGFAEVDVVDNVDRHIRGAIQRGELIVPAGVTLSYAGTYENQVRAQRTLAIVLPVSLFLIFMILYLNFRRVSTTMIIFSGIAVAWAGGFVMIWFYGQGWFGDFEVFGVNMRDTFQLHAINLSVAVWVGFLALFGIATDDGVLIATYLEQRFAKDRPDSIAAIRRATVEAGLRRAKPALMTTATTILALLPVLTSTGRGSDMMIPMAIPSVGGMSLVLLTMFTVPVLYCWVAELRWRAGINSEKTVA